MLKLDRTEREQFDLSSHRCAIHAAAPCPVEVKKQMMRWWGPIIWEYYAGTERNGSTLVGPEDWLAHPGTVGRARSGTLHICDDAGLELGPGEEGLIYFEQAARPFVYHNAPEKTAESGHPLHDNWTALGDVGYVDEEGYLYLTDRKAYLIISGGVNIYPREIEDVLIVHNKVIDVAVFGVPNDEFGEEVKAVVQPAPGVAAGPELADELSAYAREHLAGFKVPRSFDFVDELPRLPTGKLYKRILRDRYWE
jgi:acyl-CoA synthetase (AMP-forming)/AMP-acid ligase II